MKNFLLTLLLGVLNLNSFAASSSKDIDYLPQSIHWEKRVLIEGGFDKNYVELYLIKSLKGDSKITLSKSDFTIAILNDEPNCDKLRGIIKNLKQNRCSLRLRINGNRLINLPTYDNWWFIPKFNGVAFIWDSKMLPDFESLLLNANKIEVEIYDKSKFYIYEFIVSNTTFPSSTISDRITKSTLHAGKCVADLNSPLLQKISVEFGLDKPSQKNQTKINLIALNKFNDQIAEDVVKCLQNNKLLLPKFNSQSVKEDMFESILVFAKISIIEKFTNGKLIEEYGNKIAEDNLLAYGSYYTTEFAENNNFSNLLACGAFAESQNIAANGIDLVIKYLNHQANLSIDSDNHYVHLLKIDARKKYQNHLINPKQFPMNLLGCQKLITDAQK